jgi:hypothetical protein
MLLKESLLKRLLMLLLKLKRELFRESANAVLLTSTNPVMTAIIGRAGKKMR